MTDGGLDAARSYRLRVRLGSGAMICDVADAAQETPKFQRLFEVAHNGAAPVALRVGKTDRVGGATDEVQPNAEWGRCRIAQVRTFGAFDVAKAQAETGVRPKDIRVSVHYELHDGLPCYSKWITVSNGTDQGAQQRHRDRQLFVARVPERRWRERRRHAAGGEAGLRQLTLSGE